MSALLRLFRVLPATILLVLGIVAPIKAEDLSVEFDWSFVAFRQTSAGWETCPVKTDMALRSGDALKFYIHRRKPCYLYLIYLSSQGELTLLFPQRPDAYQQPLEDTAPVFLPEGDQWFELDDTLGKEKFFLLGAVKRLTSLETLIGRYAGADESHRPGLVKEVLAEIQKLRKTHKRFKRKTEKPSIVLGQVRDATPDDTPGNDEIAGLSTFIAADQFYGRTFTIDHQ